MDGGTKRVADKNNMDSQTKNQNNQIYSFDEPHTPVKYYNHTISILDKHLVALIPSFWLHVMY